MVLKEVDQEVKGGVIKLLQQFDSKKLEKIIAALKKEDYNDTKVILCEIKYEVPFEDERLKEKIAATPISRLEQFHFDLKLSPHEFYFDGNIQEILDEGDHYAAKLHQYRLGHTESVGDIDEFTQYVRLALQILQVKKKVKIKVPAAKNYKPLSFQEFLLKGHEIEVFGEDHPLKSFSDYVRFKAKTMAKRKREESLDFKIVFREKYKDLINGGTECSELEFNLKEGAPFALLEIGCNWSDFPLRQYHTATEIFTYIRSVTEKFFGLKKQTTKTSAKKK